MNTKQFLQIGGVFVILLIPFQVLATRSADYKYQSKIQALRNEIQLKDQRIVELENKFNSRSKGFSLKSVIQVSQVSPLDLQKALKKAGVYVGPIDGRITQTVVDAIKEFQKSKNLRVDGVVGKRTWQVLQNEKNWVA